MYPIFQPKPILKITAIFCGIYALSYLAYLFPFLNPIFFWLLVVGTVILSFKKLEYGVLIVLSELFIGGRGYLFSFNFFGFVMSLRLALFMAVFLIWFFGYRGINKYSFTKSKFFIAYAILTFILIFGAARGIYFGHSIKNIFFDINNYLYFALIFPIFDIISKDFINKLLRNLIAGGLAVSFLTLFMGFGFGILHPEARPDKSGILSFEFEKKDTQAEEISHTILAKEELKNYSFRRDMSEQKQPEYRWSRDTGVGELAYISGGLFRFFSASQFYLIIGVALLCFSFKNLIIGVVKEKKSEILFKIITLAIIMSAILIGFSRSIWIGVAAIFIFFLLSLPKKYIMRYVLYILAILGIIIILSGSLAPKFYDMVYDRIYTIFNPSIQSTAVTRMNILKSAIETIKEHTLLGSGFGKIIMYESVIPGASGILKVFAFEWQYLELLLKIGLIGTTAYLWLIYLIFKERYSLKNIEPNDKLLVSALIVGLAGILVTNITTPYLNHPLGIGYLIITMAIIENLKSKICL